MWANLKNYSDAALLVTRVGLATLIMLLRGWPMLAGGLGSWKRFALQELGVSLWPAVWGFLAAMAETLGCALLILGFLSRPACLALLLVFGFMSVADLQGGSWNQAADSLRLTLIFLSLLFVGPGKYSLDKG